MKRLLAIFALFALFACGGKIDREDLTIEVHGSPETLEKVKTGIQTWNETCGTNLSLVSEHGFVVITETEEGMLPETLWEGCPCLGLTIPHKQLPRKVLLMKSPPLQTVEHELGHVIGLNHLPQGVMSIGTPGETRYISDYECSIIREMSANVKTGFNSP